MQKLERPMLILSVGPPQVWVIRSIISLIGEMEPISMQKITLVRPNGGEVILSGNPYRIEWTAAAQDKVSY